MSVMDEIRKLDEQKATLLSGAKKEALETIDMAIKVLGELGFQYRLVEGGSSHSPASTPRKSGSGRRAGIREQVLGVVQENGDGVSRAKVLELMSASGDKSATQSISNALAALKKAGTVTLAGGAYKAK
jgi:hypothetical protein